MEFTQTILHSPKIQLLFREESASIVPKLLQVTLDFHSMLVRSVLTVEIRKSVAKNAPENRLSIVSFVLVVIQTVQILLKKYVLPDSEFLMFVMVVKQLVNVHF